MTDPKTEETFENALNEALQEVPEEYRESAKFLAVMIADLMHQMPPPTDRCGIKLDYGPEGANVKIMMPNEPPTQAERYWFSVMNNFLEELLTSAIQERAVFAEGNETVN